MAEEDRPLDLQQICDEYSNTENIWPPDDQWHQYTTSKIEAFIKKILKKLGPWKNRTILNAGSGGNEYGLTEFEHCHVDITGKNILSKKNHIVSTIENIPLDNQLFDLCLCVGSVINYADAMRAINEFSRLLRPGGTLILEFENSNSLEYLFKNCFRKSAQIAETFYQSKKHRLWVYSEQYIAGLIEVNNFVITDLEHIHILSPLLYRLYKNYKLAAKLANMDRFLLKVPVVNKFSSNVILACQKTF